MATEIEQSTTDKTEATINFSVAIYRGCVLPEDYKPTRITTWQSYITENPDDYSEPQLELIRQRLLAGRSWVTFASSLETLCAPDYYEPKEPYCNPVNPKDRLV